MTAKTVTQPAAVAPVESKTEIQPAELKCTLIQLLRDAKAAVDRFRKALAEASKEEKAEFDRELEADKQGRRVF